MPELFNHPWDDHEVHQRYHATLVSSIRCAVARDQRRYDALPRWRRIFKRRPQQPFTGYTAIFNEHMETHER
jgi:hypothetical protein